MGKKRHICPAIPNPPSGLATCLQMTRAFRKGELNALNAITEICVSGTINIYELPLDSIH